MHGSQSAGQSDWRDGFLFVGNNLALDLLNTRPVQDGVTVELLPNFEVLARWFQAVGLLGPSEAKKLVERWTESVRASKVMEHIRQFRELLRSEVFRLESGSAPRQHAIEEINSLLSAYPVRKRLKTTRVNLSVEEWFPIETPEDLLAPLAGSSANLFATADRRRVHKCANVDCVLHFMDTSKKGTRRWCSMRLCGNRLKVAAYAARKRRIHRARPA